MPVVSLEEHYECENVGGEFGHGKSCALRNTDPYDGSTPENLTHALMYSFYWSLLIMNVR
jgi:hypothetical protein